MKSKLSLQSHQELIELAKQMKPEERLLAFYHHSRQLLELQAAGKAVRLKSRRKKK